ncbi:MAG: glycosyltransferase [Vicinamibacterales bacterium]
MRIGLMTYEWQDMESLHYMSRLTDVSLRDRHEVLYCPPQYLHLPRAERMTLVKAWVGACDVLVVPIDQVVLQARSEIGPLGPPCVALVMGVPSRGGREIASTYKYLRTSDLLVGNCVAEVEQSRAMLPNAAVRLLPFPVDDTRFYPESPKVIDAARRSLQIDPRSKVILYSGRISLEKNLHTVLKTFGVVRQRIPGCVFVIAGAETNWPFGEFGVYALEVTRMLRKTIESLRIDPDSVRFIGQRGPDELRALYNAADVMLNLTLNHNENFGVAQVEAMLCGTRAVGTNWGGLRDTIIDGVTGRKVRAVVTGAGVKVDWWEAARMVIEELRSTEGRDARRQACRAAALERYSLTQYRDGVEAIIGECVARKDTPSEPLAPSQFARDLWALFGRNNGLPPYRRGPEAFRLYQELVRPLVGPGESGQPVPVSLTGHTAVCLPTPLVPQSKACVAINDPIFPMDVQVPADLQDTVEAVVQVLRREVVTRADRLAVRFADRDELTRTLTWMSETGLILMTACDDDDDVAVQRFGANSEDPVFNIVPVDHTVDVFYVR